MKKMRKSILALALVIAMVLSTMPISFAAEGEETTAPTGITVMYDIRSACTPDGAGKTTSTETGMNPSAYCTDKTTNGFFKYVKDSVSFADDADVKLLNEYGIVYIKYKNWIIMDINVPVAGDYKILVNNVANSKSCAAKFYVFPETVTADASALTATNYVGWIRANDTIEGVTSGIGGSWTAPQNLANAVKDESGNEIVHHFSTPGTYRLAIQAVADSEVVATSTVKQTYFEFSNIWLVSGDGNGYALIGDMTLSADSVKAGESATATATAYKSNDASLATLTYTSSNTDVATVDPATGAITAKKAGKTTISATAEGAANSISKEFVVTSADASDVTVKYDLKKLFNDTKPDKTVKFADNITYKNTNGFFAYANDSRNDVVDKTWHLRWSNGMFEMYQNQWIILEIDVPKAGTYDISMYNGKDLNGGDVSVHIFEGDGEKPDKNDLTDDNLIGKVDCEDKTLASDKTVQVTTPTYVGNHSFKKEGKYYIGFLALDSDVTPDPLPDGDSASNYNDSAYVGDIILDGGDGSALIGGVINGVSDTLEIGDSAIVSATGYLSATGAEISDFTYSVEGDAVELSGNTLTAKAEGTATITATSASAIEGCNTITKEVTVKPAEPGESVSDTLVNFTFVSSDAAAGSVSAKGYPTVGEVEIGASVEATATANDGYEFAYWRNGAGTVLSTEETATFKFNTNTAVYAEFIKLPDENAAEVPVYFYNGNGNLLESKNVAKGTLFGDAKIANPSLTGFAFKHWSDKDEEIAITNETAIDAVLRAVAIYGDSGEKYTVKADGAIVTSDAIYGSEVTVTSSDANFKAWKLGDKIVSYDKAFTFYVWGDVTLTSVTEGEEAPVAVLDEVDGNPMLIYSAPETCEIIEAGILFGEGAEIGSYESKAFAKESTGQFTAEPNGEEENKTARGYLIFKKDGVIRVIYAD